MAVPMLVSGAVLEGVLAPGDVVRSHEKAEKDCNNCHERFDKEGQDKLCVKCHEDIAKDMQATRGLHGHMKPEACRTCHADHKGRDANIVPLDKKQFDHKTTGWELKGAHAKTKCEACHDPKKKFRDAAPPCNACQKTDDKHKGRYGPKCADCHNEVKWREIIFDHNRDTDYPLRGKHETTKCDDCHKGDLYKDKLQTECIACHKKDDVHKGKLGAKCEECHNERGWKFIKFDHDKTDFPLRGKHVNVECKACHKNEIYKDTPKDCWSCHKKDDKHKDRYGHKCEDCHVEKSWKTITFDHNRDTKYMLLGKHVTTKCDDCHTGHLYNDKLRSECIACHKKDDKHKGTLGEKCETCHSEADWKKSLFDHDKTDFPLLGKHRDTKCEECHKPVGKNINYKDAPKDCYSCHKKDDKHEGQEGKRCEQCHNEKAWKPAPKFDHDLSRFPLLGKHAKVECKECHKSLRYKDAKLECLACHEKDDTKTHKKRLGPVCGDCHNPRDWKQWDFDHDKRTHFVIDGAHKKLDCYACHSRPTDKRPTLSMSCVSCHSKDDIHEGSYGRQCEQCHVTSSFKTIRRPGSRKQSSVAPDQIVVPAASLGTRLILAGTDVDYSIDMPMVLRQRFGRYPYLADRVNYAH